jgi:hypothetical protein
MIVFPMYASCSGVHVGSTTSPKIDSNFMEPLNLVATFLALAQGAAEA